MATFKVNNTNLFRITEFIKKVGVEAKPILEEVAVKKLAETSAFLFDQLWDSKSHFDMSALTKARTSIHIRQSQDDPLCFYGLTAAISVISPKSTLVSFNSPHIEAITHIIEKVAAESNLKLRPHKYIATRVPLVTEVIANFIPKTSDMEPHLPSFDERCNHAAHNGCFVKFLDEISNHEQITVRAVEDFKLWLGTEEGQASFQAALNYCKENLKQTIKNNDL